MPPSFLHFFLVLATSFALATPTMGGLITFEGLGPEGAITSVPSVPYLTIGNGILVQPGNPRRAFNGSSAGGSGGIDDANSGNTLSAPSGDGSLITLSFGVPVQGLGFDAVDIEGAQFIVAEIFDAPFGGNLLGSITLSGSDPGTGDGILTPIAFSGATGIRRFEIHGEVNGDATAGWAIDNLQFEPVPEPTTCFFGAALALVAGFSRIRRREQPRLA